MLDTGHLDRITTFPSLIEYLRDELDWPIEEYSFEDLTYEWDPSEFGLKENEISGAVEIKQLRPIEREPWGIFFLSLPHRKLPVTVLRRILGRLAVRKRASANAADRAAWDKEDLLFIAAQGAGDERSLAFAHFHEDKESGDLPTLKVLGWDGADTIRRLSDTNHRLKAKLHWRDRGEDDAHWRSRWNEAFREKPGEVIATSKALAKELAHLARQIRSRANELLQEESDKGPLRTLHRAFREALIHDLKFDDFADMYAQTIAYGLLAARISRESGALVADNAADLAPPTNPFLKELLQTFLSAGGRKGGMDFDELGVNDVVEMLRRADMHAVLLDFDTKNRNEDPVIHFYELFLKEYDAKKRMQRGVFYTPRPVVSFIVRSVDEVLRTEFGLEDGLASTATWGEVIERSCTPAQAGAQSQKGDSLDPGLRRGTGNITLPANTALTDPFVRILDPATGTGTFLVEAVDLIHGRMTEKWRKAGKSANDIDALWNDYVPRHLLPRLYGFELMMAPYAIAHMKLGLKLAETGYHFRSEERARIYLTNALEPAQDFDMQLAFMSEALAHEAQAANRAKEVRFTVVIGNPPYSQYSANLQDFAKAHIEPFRSANGAKIKARNALQLERNLNDDYVKFFGLAFGVLPVGMIGMITNRYYLESKSLVGLREAIVIGFDRTRITDLMGSAEEAQRVERLRGDENVFDIKQGVAIAILARTRQATPTQSDSTMLIGSREKKIDWLLTDNSRVDWTRVKPQAPNWLLSADVQAQSDDFLIPDVLPEYSTLVASNRDPIVVAIDATDVIQKVSEVARSELSNAAWSEHFGITLKTNWNVNAARAQLRALDIRKFVEPIEYRPFDRRSIFYHRSLVWQMAPVPSGNVLSVPKNLAIVSLGKSRDELTNAVWVTATLADKSVLTTRDNASGFPLWLKGEGTDDRIQANLSCDFTDAVSAATTLQYDACTQSLRQKAAAPSERGDLETTFGPRDVFDWIYAVLHSPAYRARYADYLKSDFARIPLPGSRALFQELVPLGAKLVALHLLDAEAAPELKDPQGVRFAGHGDARVERKPEWSAAGGNRVTISSHRWFEGVPERVWNFHIGGYQPAQKWLKDRAARGGKKAGPGRILTAEDQLHYRRMIVAMDRTIELMAEIDRVIDKHGGWPAAFKGMGDAECKATAGNYQHR